MTKRKYEYNSDSESESESESEITEELIIKQKNKYNHITNNINNLSTILHNLQQKQRNILEKRKLLCKEIKHGLISMRESGPYGEKYDYCPICKLEF